MSRTCHPPTVFVTVVVYEKDCVTECGMSCVEHRHSQAEPMSGEPRVVVLEALAMVDGDVLVDAVESTELAGD